MKFSFLSRAVATLALATLAALPAQAAVVDFEDLAPTLFSGSSISSSQFDFASAGLGFSGVDSTAGFGSTSPPTGSSGQFLFGLNADALTMTRIGGLGFQLLGFDFGFVAPLGGLGAALTAGLLHVEAVAIGGGVIVEDLDFGVSDAAGIWSFQSYAGNAFAGGVSSITFSACAYDGAGGCNFADALSQFAIDNLAFVPEPGGVTLALTALGLLAATRRRGTV